MDDKDSECNSECGYDCEHNRDPDSESVMNDAEPFETFQTRVHALASKVIWPDAAPEEITVDRMQEGGYNRIIGITYTPADGTGQPAEQRVLRMPWWKDQEDGFNKGLAQLVFLKQYPKICTPEVLSFDKTSVNALGFPYTLQNRVPGVSLQARMAEPPENFGGKNTHEQWVQLAQEMGSAVKELLSTHSSVAGTLTLSPDNTMTVIPFPYRKEPSEQHPYDSSSRPTKWIEELLTDVFNEQRRVEIENEPSLVDEPMMHPHFIRMVSEMVEMGFLTDNIPNALCHMDFYPRNILVDPSTLKLNAILDWDSAVFAPAFLAARPPTWLWNHELDKEDLEEHDGYFPNPESNEPYDPFEPTTEKGQEIKETFERYAGEEYMKYAYEPGYRLARRLVRFAMKPIGSEQELYEAQGMVNEWNTLCAKLTVMAEDSDEVIPMLVSVIERSWEDDESHERAMRRNEEPESDGGLWKKMAGLWRGVFQVG
ncbi:hypothetical protein QBC35DRAFT_392098 [Podospora australis]|uniref:Aminoglycoside phosphotransferase domain-containing protein n=1 Tax=Podospora australis TaxID=1536484 RepID=A0AAN7AD66_9PEZI|nr:hypothetical protein QBC35DRAFT_392098 [Podospora australis]